MSYGHDDIVYRPSADFAARARFASMSAYRDVYDRSIRDPENFWAEVARDTVVWRRPFTKVMSADFERAQFKWYEDGTLNVTESCLDRHVQAGRGDKVAIIWEGNDPSKTSRLTYSELLHEVCRFANVLKAQGVEAGDRVCFYMPMIPELAIAMLACARIGAVHSIVFGGFSADALRDRILDAQCKVVVTADSSFRGTKEIRLKDIVDASLESLDVVEACICFKHSGALVTMRDDRDHWAHDLLAKVDATCEAIAFGAEHPLFILYTSGSTGKPKGVLHTCGGYLTYAAYTHRIVFDIRDEDIYWCTADIGWGTGHSYIVYGPLCNGATTLMFEGIPTWPDVGRFWDVVDKHAVTILYTAPTAIRALMRAGDAPVKARRRTSLRLLGTVGEPINPEAWRWYHEVVGDARCPIVDTWWQTETGGILIAPLPGSTPTKPGSATLPLPGIVPVLVDESGAQLDGNNVSGMLCIDSAWPGMMRTVYGDHERFRSTYFARFPGRYFTGDGCHRDEDGYYWITGRVDDVHNVSGHRIGTAEVESALVGHANVAEAAVVGRPDDITGEAIYAYVILNEGVLPSDEARHELLQQVRTEIGAFAVPKLIHFTPGLPKTRSGKIMRRILRKIAAGQIDDLGDTSTLADPDIVRTLIDTAPRH